MCDDFIIPGGKKIQLYSIYDKEEMNVVSLQKYTVNKYGNNVLFKRLVNEAQKRKLN